MKKKNLLKVFNINNTTIKVIPLNINYQYNIICNIVYK